jgi:hypothetical protein
MKKNVILVLLSAVIMSCTDYVDQYGGSLGMFHYCQYGVVYDSSGRDPIVMLNQDGSPVKCYEVKR